MFGKEGSLVWWGFRIFELKKNGNFNFRIYFFEYDIFIIVFEFKIFFFLCLKRSKFWVVNLLGYWVFSY